VSADTTNELSRGYFPSYNVPYFPEIYKKSGYEILDGRKNKRIFSEYELAPRAKIFRRDQGSVSSVEGLKILLRSNGYVNKPPKALKKTSSSSSSLRRLEATQYYDPEKADEHELFRQEQQGGFFSRLFHDVQTNGLPSKHHHQHGKQHEPVVIGVDDMGDPFADTPWMAICSRGDLNPKMESLQGCYDSKATSASLFMGFEAHDVYEFKNDNILAHKKRVKRAKKSVIDELTADKLNHLKRFPMSAWVINGPTNQHQPTFTWKEVKGSYQNATGSSDAVAINAGDAKITGFASHLGMVDKFDFKYEIMAPRWPTVQKAEEDSMTKKPTTTTNQQQQASEPAGLELASEASQLAFEASQRPTALNIGGQKDAHGCLVAAGYSWCETLAECIRVWETDCPK
jgi:hypothetical protein